MPVLSQIPVSVWPAGTATGTLHQVDRIQPGALEGAAPDEDVVLLVKEASGDEEVGATGLRLRGVILAHSLPHLSHLGEFGSTGLACLLPMGPSWCPLLPHLQHVAVASCGRHVLPCVVLHIAGWGDCGRTRCPT